MILFMKHVNYGLFLTALFMLLTSVYFTSCASGPAERPQTLSASRDLDGTWAGVLSIGEQTLKATVHIFEGGALLDIPEQGMWSYPLGTVTQKKDSVSFELSLGANPLPVTLSLNTVYLEGSFGSKTDGDASSLEASPSTNTSPSVGDPTANDTAAKPIQGRFSLMRLDVANPMHPLTIKTAGGSIRGELDLAETGKKGPLVIISPDSGSVDRDGNILGVGGKGNTYQLLSSALVQRGISCVRYDKRGVAESYPLVKDTVDLRFSDYVGDLQKVLAHFRADKRFTSISILGHGEGALVAAAALQNLEDKGLPVSFFALSPQSRPVQELLHEEIASYGPESLVEYERVLEDILAGGTGEPLPDFLMDVFTPDMLNYWRSWMQYDPLSLYAKLGGPLFLVRGANETVCLMEDIDRLAAANKGAKYLVIPGMNQVLKEGAGDQNALYEAYLDGSLPLSADLVQALAVFVLGE